MGEQRLAPRRIARLAAIIALTGLGAACSSEPPAPAPVILNGAAPGVIGGAMLPGAPPAAIGAARHIVVRPGQSLRGIAHAYHVPERAIIAANHLTPPYKLEGGRRLLIPGGAAEPVRRAALPPPPALSPTIPSEAPMAAGHPPPDIIPLDGPAPAAAPRTSSAAAPAAKSPPGLSAAEEARAESKSSAPAEATASAAPLPHGGHFPWPVRGRVLAGYGVAPGGAHNDGINIAAPRGAAIEAVDDGVVAYAGNELRGYGNLVLVKHANGWISAYAHCDELLVKKGEKVSRGETIAKVGATGGVAEPQLHFELRRGKRAVDPREFLAPAPSADAGHRAERG